MWWFYVNSYGETLLGPEHSARCTEHVPYGFTQAKDGLKLDKKMPSHHKRVILGSLSLYLRKPEPSDFPNQYFLIMIPELTLYYVKENFISNMHDLYKVSQGVIGVTLFSLLRLPHKFYIFESQEFLNFVILNGFLSILLNQLRTIHFVDSTHDREVTYVPGTILFTQGMGVNQRESTFCSNLMRKES